MSEPLLANGGFDNALEVRLAQTVVARPPKNIAGFDHLNYGSEIVLVVGSPVGLSTQRHRSPAYCYRSILLTKM